MVVNINNLDIHDHFSLKKHLEFFIKSLEVNEKSVPLQSQMKNGWLKRPGVLTKTDAEK